MAKIVDRKFWAPPAAKGRDRSGQREEKGQRVWEEVWARRLQS